MKAADFPYDADVCAVVTCKAPATDRGMCAMHSHYFRVFLADPYWRDHEPPEPEQIEIPMQGALL